MIGAKIAVVVGTRPGIVKMSPVVRALEARDVPHFIIHTGQHYSPRMDDIFMRELRLSTTVSRLASSEDKITHGAMTAHMLAGVEEVLIAERPNVVLVCGDANTNLAGGLAARKLNLILGHVESGLRSYDWRMPEEHNRVMLDHISDLLFAPTPWCVENLKREHVRGEIHLVGNTVVDALREHLDIARSSSNILEEVNVKHRGYLLLTTHREENVDDPTRLGGILEGVRKVLTEQELPVLFPVHPRTRRRISDLGFSSKVEDLALQGLRVIDPVGYLDFLVLLGSARLVFTDSGGIQEEACILGVPTVTLRDNSERPETIDAGSNVLAGTTPDRIAERVNHQLHYAPKTWTHPFGDGRTGRRIVDITITALREGVQLSG